MKVLIACEESQRVCIEFRKKGHEAYEHNETSEGRKKQRKKQDFPWDRKSNGRSMGLRKEGEQK